MRHNLLEAALGMALPERQWADMVSVGLLLGALMSLWEKALSLEAGTPVAAEEWRWWIDQLLRPDDAWIACPRWGPRGARCVVEKRQGSPDARRSRWTGSA
jgi:hypothetical protein